MNHTCQYSSPLVNAIRWSDEPTIQFLLENGADAALRTHDMSLVACGLVQMEAPLHLAAKQYPMVSRACIGAMVRHSASIDLLDAEGRTPLFHAALVCSANALVFLQNGATIGNNIIWRVAQDGKTETVTQLLRLGAECTHRIATSSNRLPVNAITAALSYGHKACAMALLEWCAEQHCVDDAVFLNWTPLPHLARFGDSPVGVAPLQCLSMSSLGTLLAL